MVTSRKSGDVRFAAAADRFHAALIAPSPLPEGGMWSASFGGREIFWLGYRSEAGPAYYRLDAAARRLEPLFDVDHLRLQLGAASGDLPAGTELPFEELSAFDDTCFLARYGGRWMLIDAQTSELRELSGDDPRIPRAFLRPAWLTYGQTARELRSADGTMFAGLNGRNLRVRDLYDETVFATHEPDDACCWDIEAGAGGAMPRFAWSPDSARLFACRLDRRAVPKEPIVSYVTTPLEISHVHVQRVAGPIDVASPHIIDLRAGRVIAIDVGAPADGVVTLVGWSDCREVIFARHHRDFTRMDLFAADAVSGAVRLILSESDPTFVDIPCDLVYARRPLVYLLPGHEGCVLRSSRSGRNHLYHYRMDGELITRLTDGPLTCLEVQAIVENTIYFTAHSDPARPYDTQVCRLSLADRRIELLTGGDGQNKAVIAPSGRAACIVNSKVDREPRLEWLDLIGGARATIDTSATANGTAASACRSEEFSVLAADGETPLWGVIHLPAAIEPGRRYPLIEHIYAGPQTVFARRDAGKGQSRTEHLDRALTELGFIVVTLDGRGTPERSKRFHNVVHGRLGEHEIADHASAIRQLGARYRCIDVTRVGIWGHSLGGYFAIRALMDESDLYRVGVACAPVAALSDAALLEAFFGPAAHSPQRREGADLYDKVQRIRGRLMLIAGSADPIIFGNTMKLVHRLIAARIDHETVILPDARHTAVGADEDYLIAKLISHFLTHL